MNLSSNITQRIWFILVLYQRDIQRERGNLQAVAALLGQRIKQLIPNLGLM